MYRYTDFDRSFLRARAAQFRHQLARHLAGELSDDAFKPWRLQNGWYVQRHAPMLRVAVPYGELSAFQLRTLARVAREFDHRDVGQASERGGFGHFTTRHNLQFNWIPLAAAADVMDVLAQADLHGIQTSGNCIRNITSDAWAGIAPDEVVDPRPYCELLRQWSTLHPEFAFLPRKFKIAVTGAKEDRTASAWHDIGLGLRRNEHGEVGFRVSVGGGMGRTPLLGRVAAEFVPWSQILLFLEAIVRTYNLYGRRDQLYKSRIKILVRAEGQRFLDAVQQEFAALLRDDDPAATNLIPQSRLDAMSRHFEAPAPRPEDEAAPADPQGGASASSPAFTKWLQRNVHDHRVAGYRAVTLSLKRPGQPPGDVSAQQMEAAAELAERFSRSELRVTHRQNLLLPWVRRVDLPALWSAARELGFGLPNAGLLSDMIACPGGDLCALANARSLPLAAAIAERFDDLDQQHDIGDIDLHISGCINSCGHHHSGHIGILGVDKDGSEWYQVTVGGTDGSARGGQAEAGKVIGPAFSAEEVPDAVEALIDTYLGQRWPGERFIDTVRRLGSMPFRQAADAIRAAGLAPAAPGLADQTHEPVIA